MRQVGYVLSGCDQSKVSFVVMENAEIKVNSYYFINHPSTSVGEFNPVLLRVYKITPYNPEMTVGSFGPIAGKKGEKAYYGKKLEYLIAQAEVLGYISPDGKWRRLECSPNTWDSVYEPSHEELEIFFAKLTGKTLKSGLDFPVKVGRHRGLNMPFHLDLNAIAKGHLFVSGMSVEYEEPLVYMVKGLICIEEIGKFVDRFFSDDSEGSASVNDVWVPSFNPQTYEVRWRPVAEVIRHRYHGSFVRITAETGRSITVTPDHSIFILRNCEVLTVPASEIKVGDYVVAPSEISPPQNPVSEIDVSEILMKSGDVRGVYFHNVPDSVYNRLSKEKLWFKEDASRRFRWRRRSILPLKYTRLLTLDEKAQTVLAAKRGIGVSTIIKVDEEFVRLLGYYVAKGSAIIDSRRGCKVIFNLGLDDMKTIEDIRMLIEKLSSKPRVKIFRKSLSYRVIVYDKVLALLLKSLVHEKAKSKRVPWIILNSKPKLMLEFLKAWFTGDSGVTASRWLASDVQYLFLICGVLASFHIQEARNGVLPGDRHHGLASWYSLKFPTSDLTKAERRLFNNPKLVPVDCLPDLLRGFSRHHSRCRVTEKILRRVNRLAECIKSVLKGEVRVKSETAADNLYRFLQGSGFIRRDGYAVALTDKCFKLIEATAKLSKLLKGGLSFLRVIKVERVKSKHSFVYDLSVPGCENFVAGFGGVFCHNTRSGKSTFVLNLIVKSLECEPKPRFIVFDRRCEYGVLAKYGALVLPYYRFVPRVELVSPELLVSRLGLDPRRSDGKLLCEALNAIKAEGCELTAESLLRKCVKLSPYLLSRSRESVLARIRWALEKRGGRFFERAPSPLSIVKTLYEKPAVVVDFSVDTNVEDQQLAAKYILRSVVNHAVKRRRAGDFAAIFVIEEAQYFIPERGLKIEVGSPEKTGVDKQIIEAISQAGGYNIGFILVTQRPAYISKCLSGDMIIQLYDGELVTVKRLYERLRDESSLVVELNHETVVYPKEDIYLSTLSRDLNRVGTRLIAISKRKGLKRLLRIKTHDGYILECSPEHRIYLIDRYGDLVEKEAGDLNPGEQLLLVYPITQPATLNLSPIMKETKLTVRETLKRRDTFNMRSKLYNRNWSKAVRTVHEIASIPYFTIQNWVQGLQNPFGYGLDLNRVNVYMGKSVLSARITPVKITDKMTPDLGEVLGLIVSGRYDILADPSYTLKFVNKNPDVLNRFKHLSKNILEVVPKEGFRAGNLRMRLTGLMRILKSLGYKPLVKAQDKEIPLCVQKSPDDVVSAFLRGLFEGGGYISLKNRRIGLITTGKILAYQVLFLMFRLGFKPKLIVKTTRCKNKVSKMFEIRILDKEGILMFKRKIGFISRNKKTKLDKLVSIVKHKRCRGKCDYVPLSPDLLKNAVVETYGGLKYHHLWCDVFKRRRRLSKYRLKRICKILSESSRKNGDSLKLLKRIADAPISFSTIKEVEELQVEEVYDLETEACSLIAGGAPFLVHNSVISQCNTIAAFRLMAGNDQEAIIRYSEYGSERMADYLPGLADHEALVWGMASPVPFPVTVEMEVKYHPSKSSVPAKVAWSRMEKMSRRGG